MNLRKAGLFLVPVSLALCAGPGVARYSVDAALVLVPVTVTDRDGRSLTNLQREQFQVLEDASPQQIVSFSQEDAPASIGLIVDVSGSMKGKLHQALAAARNITGSCEERDETFLITFADQARLLSVSQGYPSDVLRPLQYASAAGATSLIDAVVLGLHQSRKASHRRRALVVISDGMDNQSRYTPSELLSQARESDAVIYTISLRESALDTSERRGAMFLEQLSETTGGLHHTIRHRDDLPAAAAKIAHALKNVYVIGYRPEPSFSGKWRKLRVKVSPPANSTARVAAPSGYYEPR